MAKVRGIRRAVVGFYFYDNDGNPVGVISVPVKGTCEIEMSDEKAREMIAQFERRQNYPPENPMQVL